MSHNWNTYSIVYDKYGYIEIVGGAAEQAMVEVRNLPADEHEVCHTLFILSMN